MRNFILLLNLMLALHSAGYAQVAVNNTGNSPAASAMLDISSTDKGLLIPRMTKQQREAIQNPATGLLVFQTDNPRGFYYHDLFGWETLSTVDNSWGLRGNSGTNQYQDFIGTTDAQDLSFRVNNEYKLKITQQGQWVPYGTGGSVFIGRYAGENDNLSYNENVFIGEYAGQSNVSGKNNLAIGFNSMKDNVSGNQNTAFGSYSQQHTLGDGNSAFGFQSLQFNGSGQYNSAFGTYALMYNTSGESNTAIGNNALKSNLTGSSNVGVGVFALLRSNGTRNTALGESSLSHVTTGDNNIGVGYQAGNNITKGSRNITIGYNTYVPIDTADYQLNIGNLIYANDMNGSGSNISTGNVGIGVKNPSARLEVNGQIKITGGNPGSGKILVSNADGLASWDSIAHTIIYDADSNTLVQVEKNSNEDKIRFSTGGTEYLVLENGHIKTINTGGSVFLGEGAGQGDILLSPHYNTFVGYNAGRNNNTGFSNVACGVGALFLNTSISHLVAIGDSALFWNGYGASGTQAQHNIAIGSRALYFNSKGANNTAVGFEALEYNNIGDNNTATGKRALFNNSSGFNNTAFGKSALINNLTGSNNTAIGCYANVLANDLDYATAIGAYAFVSQSNSLVLGGTGDSYVNVGIGTDAPNNLLDVVAQTSNDATVRVLSPDSHKSILKLFEAGNYGYEFQYDGNIDKLFLWSRQFAGNEGIRMTWLKNGNVGIGTETPSYRLQVGEAGDGSQARANAWNTFSDKRWKTNITKIDNPIKKLQAINGYYYQWREGKDKSLQVGVIAQEVEKVLPEIVSTDNNGYKSVDYSKLTPLLIETVKQQQQTINDLSKRLEQLEKMMDK